MTMTMTRRDVHAACLALVAEGRYPSAMRIIGHVPGIALRTAQRHRDALVQAGVLAIPAALQPAPQRRGGIVWAGQAPHGHMLDESRDEELRDRIALVRAAKAAKTRGMIEMVADPSLTDRELDAVLEPVDCARTRRRLARQEAAP